MTQKEELAIAWESAWSFEPRRPTDLRYIGAVTSKRTKTTYHFYKDASGTYWYKSVHAKK